MSGSGVEEQVCVFRKSCEPQIYINDWSHLAGILKSYNVFIANAYDQLLHILFKVHTVQTIPLVYQCSV